MTAPAQNVDAASFSVDDEIEALLRPVREKLAQLTAPTGPAAAPAAPAHLRFILEALCRGVRAAAEREHCSPFRWPGYAGWLADLHTDDELVIAVARDAGLVLACVDDAAVLSDGERAMRCPSRAAALVLAELVDRHCGFLPTDRAVRRAMAILAARAWVTS